MARAQPSSESGQKSERASRLDRDARERQLLDCAIRLYREHPPAEVSIGAVARAAGVTPGLVHHYFGDRRGLYLAAVREILSDVEAPPLVWPPEMSQQERLDASIDRWLTFVETNKETWLATVGAEGLGRDPEVEDLVDRVREATVDRVIEVLDLGPPRRVSPTMRSVIRAYGGLAEFTARQWLRGRGLDRQQAHILLLRALVVLVNEIEPDVERAGKSGGRRRPSTKQAAARGAHGSRTRSAADAD